VEVKRWQDQPGQPSPMSIRMPDHASEQQEEIKFNIHRWSNEDDDLQVGDIFAKVEILQRVSNMCLGYSWTWVGYVLESNSLTWA
jgi:hypothetical protein